jgi:hypothetical protein
VISASSFALLGVPVLILQDTLKAYLWVSGAVVAGFLLAAALAVLLVPSRRRRSIKPEADPSASDRGGMLWAPFLALVAALAYVCIPAYSSETNVVSRRGSLVLRVLPQLEERASGRIEVPRGSLDVQEFFRGTSLQRGGSRSCAATRWTK